MTFTARREVENMFPHNSEERVSEIIDVNPPVGPTYKRIRKA